MGILILDTNVLVYALGGDHPLRGPCRDLLAAVAAESAQATTTLEVLQEFAQVRARRHGRRDAAARVANVFPSLDPLPAVTSAHLRAGLDLWQRHDSLQVLDAVLAAVALATDATLVSADKAFARIRNLDHVVPDARGVKRLMAG